MPVVIETKRFASEQAGRLLRRLAFQVSQTSRSCNPNAVHDLRVAIRRFAQALVVFKPWFPGKDIRKILKRLKRIMYHAGEVRNHDIALMLLAGSKLESAAALRPKLQKQRKEAERDLIGLMHRWIDRKTSIKWRGAIEAALTRTDSSSAETASSTADRILPEMLEDFLRRGNATVESNAGAEELHAFRIASKKFRYTLEIFAPLYGAKCQHNLEKLKRIQDLLGENNDWATVEKLLEQNKGIETLIAWLQNRQRRTTEEFYEFWQQEFQGIEEWQSWMAARRPARKRASTAKKQVSRSEQAADAAKARAAVA